MGDIYVSTVFLGIDHSFRDVTGHEDDPPVLFETMIFGGEHDQYQERYSSRAQALIGHAKALELVQAS